MLGMPILWDGGSNKFSNRTCYVHAMKIFVPGLLSFSLFNLQCCWCYETIWLSVSTQDPSMAVSLSSLFRSIISILCCLRIYLVPLLFNLFAKTIVMLIVGVMVISARMVSTS